jgi:lysophospholipase L1-like esterase
MSSRFFLSLTGILLVPGLQAAENFWDEIPPSPSTTRPAAVVDDYWNSQFLRVNREVADARDTSLVFFGDSITWSWSLGPATGKKVWADRFTAFKPVNMGNSGDITPVMLHRVTRGNLGFAEGRHPKVAVLLCGINNFIVTQSAGGKESWALGADCPPEDIAHGQRAIAQVFRRRLPGTRVILMALLPVADRTKWEKCRRVNEINARLAVDSNEVAYLNLQDLFLQPDGTLNKSMFTDGIHLSEDGYQAWAKGLEPVLGKFMLAPPLAPVKIMPIGGSATEAADSSTCYRRYLDGMLRKSGHLIDFVGSRSKHGDEKTEPESYQFDPDHEGHWGRDSTWIADHMPRLLERQVPDVAVIQLGAEEISASQAAAEPTAEGIARNVQRVIGSLRSKNPKVKIVVATVLPMKGKEEVIDRLNKKLLLLASPPSSAQTPVVVAALDRGFDPELDLGKDTSLPTAGGAAKIAATLSDAIRPLLGNPSAK